MYNEEIKKQFLAEEISMCNQQPVVSLFNRFSKYEDFWGCDLCTKNREEISEVLEDIVGIRSSAQVRDLGFLNKYNKWCINNNISEAKEWGLSLCDIGVSRLQSQMRKSPIHLQKNLNEVFAAENKWVFIAYYWLAFSGIYDDAIALNIRVHEVSIDNRTICDTYEIYEESIEVFQKCIGSGGFDGISTKYNRSGGDFLLRRGGLDEGSAHGFRSQVSLYVRKHETQLSYRNVWLSGIFYRTYLAEQSGMPPDFTGIVEVVSKTNKQSVRKQIAGYYLQDYTRWKQAFNL